MILCCLRSRVLLVVYVLVSLCEVIASCGSCVRGRELVFVFVVLHVGYGYGLVGL